MTGPDPKVVECCEAMAWALGGKAHHCIPSIRVWDGDAVIVLSCDADWGEKPLKFCPWCGREIALEKASCLTPIP